MGKPHYAAVTLLILGTFGVVLCQEEQWERVCKQDLAEYVRLLKDFNRGRCLRSINNAIEEYEGLHKKLASYNGYSELIKLYDVARRTPTVNVSAGLTTYAGHPIFCDREIAENVSRITRETAGHPSASQHIYKEDGVEDSCE